MKRVNSDWSEARTLTTVPNPPFPRFSSSLNCDRYQLLRTPTPAVLSTPPPPPPPPLPLPPPPPAPAANPPSATSSGSFIQLSSVALESSSAGGASPETWNKRHFCFQLLLYSHRLTAEVFSHSRDVDRRRFLRKAKERDVNNC